MRDVYFSDPAMGELLPFENLCADMLAARSDLVMASAWLTQNEMAAAFIQSPAEHKLVLVSNVSTDESKVSQAIKTLRNHAVNSLDTCFVALGGDEWQDGQFHFKLLVADDVVWTGSANFTYASRKNWEYLEREVCPQTAEVFITKAWQIAGLTRDEADASCTVCGSEEARVTCGTCGELVAQLGFVLPSESCGCALTVPWTLCESCRVAIRVTRSPRARLTAPGG